MPKPCQNYLPKLQSKGDPYDPERTCQVREIQKKHHLVDVLPSSADEGAAPGAWQAAPLVGWAGGERVAWN